MRPSFFEAYMRYLRNNPEGYWFKRKAFGWGWTPATWQGWLVILVFMAIFILNLLRLGALGEKQNEEEVLWQVVTQSAVLVAILVFICYKKGERPRWQWGFPKNEKKDSDSSLT